MVAGMTSAIMNPVMLPVNRAKIDAKKEAIRAAGIMLPEDMDDETFVTLFGMGSTSSKAGKEMEAIRAANFLMDNDASGGAWIKFNKVPGDDAGGRGGRKRRRG